MDGQKVGDVQRESGSRAIGIDDGIWERVGAWNCANSEGCSGGSTYLECPWDEAWGIKFDMSWDPLFFECLALWGIAISYHKNKSKISMGRLQCDNDIMNN